MVFFWVILGLLLSGSIPAEADIYKYVDEEGVIFYTDSPMGKKAGLLVKKENVVTAAIPKTTLQQLNPNYHSIISEKASKYDIDPQLIKAVIKTESNGNPVAISKKGAIGLMQLMPYTANELRVANPFDPEENIEGGIRYLRYLLERFNGDLTLALAAYNAGPKSVEKFGTVPPFTETRQYVKKVLSMYNGKPTHKLASTPRIKGPEPIYRIELADGTVLFTNSLLTKEKATKF